MQISLYFWMGTHCGFGCKRDLKHGGEEVSLKRKGYLWPRSEKADSAPMPLGWLTDWKEHPSRCSPIGFSLQGLCDFHDPGKTTVLHCQWLSWGCAFRPPCLLMQGGFRRILRCLRKSSLLLTVHVISTRHGWTVQGQFEVELLRWVGCKHCSHVLLSGHSL